MCVRGGVCRANVRDGRVCKILVTIVLEFISLCCEILASYFFRVEHFGAVLASFFVMYVYILSTPLKHAFFVVLFLC